MGRRTCRVQAQDTRTFLLVADYLEPAIDCQRSNLSRRRRRKARRADLPTGHDPSAVIKTSKIDAAPGPLRQNVNREIRVGVVDVPQLGAAPIQPEHARNIRQSSALDRLKSESDKTRILGLSGNNREAVRLHERIAKKQIGVGS
jgi:hypothetical protein